ncbi:hypothetical protein GCM10009551_000310 [Nocardiopsis tropica]
MHVSAAPARNRKGFPRGGGPNASAENPRVDRPGRSGPGGRGTVSRTRPACRYPPAAAASTGCRRMVRILSGATLRKSPR